MLLGDNSGQQHGPISKSYARLEIRTPKQRDEPIVDIFEGDRGTLKCTVETHPKKTCKKLTKGEKAHVDWELSHCCDAESTKLNLGERGKRYGI